jgi:hypothetical protein
MSVIKIPPYNSPVTLRGVLSIIYKLSSSSLSKAARSTLSLITIIYLASSAPVRPRALALLWLLCYITRLLGVRLRLLISKAYNSK